MIAIDVWDAVVLRQSFVEERIVGGQQIHHIAVVADLALKERARLLGHRVAEILVELGIEFRIGQQSRDLVQL